MSEPLNFDRAGGQGSAGQGGPGTQCDSGAGGAGTPERRDATEGKGDGTPARAALVVERLCAAYGGLAVLHEVSLYVKPGELVALIGPNGAGKTTLLRALSGLLPSTGRIQLGQRALQGCSPREFVQAGVIHCPEGRQLFPDLSVEDNLRLGAHLRCDREAVEADVDLVCELFPGLKLRLRQRAASLSGGEQQMLAIARALMGRPTVLMLDEPSFGIAPLVVGQLFDVLRELNAQGLTALVVEQNAQLALAASQRAYALEEGRIALHGPSAELAQHEGVRTAYLGL
ncbi:ABC transporter ATP-binding protein [Mitsuaria sp. WAJ17]|uniref:ABC transporter ATP-binding protein n=1 Tax=Mitsuaria sp. WAJ17 TaxID=2761452 RepID=UPI001602ABB3|nr:ABC transporter ATP-binding protein [Mitsuaria sp. WAJ17]MBB2485473.1 ABC transporter ATP-binding protein [Mitsuaria sp. WAJ17]